MMTRISYFLVLAAMTASVSTQAQFIDEFDQETIEDWEYFTGDGDAEMEFTKEKGFSRIEVDATKDKHNVWWAIIKRDVSEHLDMKLLEDPAYELRVEAKVRASHAPRRVNFMINTQRTTDYHEHLREYDLPDTTAWHTISMTTTNLDAKPGDHLYVQLGVTDWGFENYHVDLDYYKAEIVRVDTAEPDLGEPLVYHPPAVSPKRFSHHLAATHDALINSNFPNLNFHNWQNGDDRVLTINAMLSPILRWDFGSLRGKESIGAGVLEFTTQSVSKGGNYIDAYGEDLGIEFGKVRVIEISGGYPDWNQNDVTFNSFTQGNDLSAIANSQMIFDTELASEQGGKTYVTLSRPVMQRLLDGTTRGLILRPLGAIVASIYDSESASESLAPKLHFTTKD